MVITRTQRTIKMPKVHCRPLGILMKLLLTPPGVIVMQVPGDCTGTVLRLVRMRLVDDIENTASMLVSMNQNLYLEAADEVRAVGKRPPRCMIRGDTADLVYVFGTKTLTKEALAGIVPADWEMHQLDSYNLVLRPSRTCKRAAPIIAPRCMVAKIWVPPEHTDALREIPLAALPVTWVQTRDFEEHGAATPATSSGPPYACLDISKADAALQTVLVAVEPGTLSA